MHHAAVAVVVVERVVQAAAVVPQRQRARAPLEAAGELGADLVGTGSPARAMSSKRVDGGVRSCIHRDSPYAGC